MIHPDVRAFPGRAPAGHRKSGPDDTRCTPQSPRPRSGPDARRRRRAILRRLQPRMPSSPSARDDDAPEGKLAFPGITIDPSCRTVHTAVGAATVTALDYDLLLALARHPGMVLSRRQLLAAAWDDDAYVDERVVNVHIRRLRRALGDDATHPLIIETVRSVGYRFLPRPT